MRATKIARSVGDLDYLDRRCSLICIARSADSMRRSRRPKLYSKLQDHSESYLRVPSQARRTFILQS